MSDKTHFVATCTIHTTHRNNPKRILRKPLRWEERDAFKGKWAVFGCEDCHIEQHAKDAA